MTETEKIQVTPVQFEALREVSYRAMELRRIAGSLTKVGRQTVEELDAGHSPWGLSHQIPKDYWVNEARMETAVYFARLVLDTPELRDLIVEAVQSNDDSWAFARLAIER